MGNYEYEPIKKLKENNKKKMFFMFLTIFMFLGISLATIYFVYRFNDERENTITSGLVDIDFKEQGASINLQNTVPMTDEAGKKNDPYIFTVENISKIPVNLKIGIEIGENTIDLSAIRYALYLNNEEVKIGNLGNLDSENNLYIKEQFASGAKVEVKLVFWIDYYYEKSGGSFSGKIKVEGEQYDIIYEETAAETIKKTLVPYSKSSLEGFAGGLVAVNTNGELYNETEANQEIREYRYSGPNVNNYIYFNCETDATVEDANSKCELWRIIGVFKDENEEFVKIVSNKLLESNKIPFNYQINNIDYVIKTKEPFDYSQGVYWNKSEDGNAKLDWTTSGLQYYLNTETDESGENKGYFNYLSSVSKTMIRESNYYLGNIHIDATNSYSNYDNTILAYTHERDESNISSDQKSKWKGKVALMYPSDVGYANLSKNWNLKLHVMQNQKNYNWIFNTMEDVSKNGNWLISRGDTTWAAMILARSGSLGTSNYTKLDSLDDVYQTSFMYDYNVRPTLYLKSDVKIDGGIGSQDSPYMLTME